MRNEAESEWQKEVELQENVRKAVVELDMAYTEGYLVDLHSHLLGMGDATFWTNLMCDYIPAKVRA